MSELLTIKTVIPDEPDYKADYFGRCSQCGKELYQGYTWFEFNDSFGRVKEVCPDCLQRYINDRKVTA